MSLDVLYDHRAIVDQDADASAKPPSVHGVHRLADEIHEHRRRDDRHRDRRQNDEGQPPIAKEQQDHSALSGQPPSTAHHDAFQRRPNEDGLIEDRLDRHVGGQQFSNVGQRVHDAVDHRQGRHALSLAHGQQSARSAVDRDRIALHLVPVVNVGDIADEHGVAIDFFDGISIYGGDDVGAVVHSQRVILAADFHVARGSTTFCFWSASLHVRRGQSARLQRLGVQIDHHDARHAAIGIGDRRAAHDGEVRTDDVLPESLSLVSDTVGLDRLS